MVLFTKKNSRDFRALSQTLCSCVAPMIRGTQHSTVFCKIYVRKSKYCLEFSISWGRLILGDPGAVSPVGRKGGTKVFRYEPKSPWVQTLTELFPKIQVDAASWLGTKNALYYCAQSANSFSWVLFVSSYTTAIVSPHLPGSFTKLVRARETFIFYFPNQKRRNYRWVEKTFGMLSAGAIQFAPRIFCFWRITMYRK